MLPWIRNLGKEGLQQVYLRRHFLWRLPANTVFTAALTFDDGPHPVHTPQVLDLLARQDVKATFFVIGRHVAQYPTLVRRMVAEGHSVGGHTFDHREIVGLTDAELAQELESCRRAIQDAAGIDTRLMRPPRGKISLGSLTRTAKLGYRVVHWSKTYSDYQCDAVSALWQRMQQQPPQPRDIVLLHDHNAVTVEALGMAIPLWRSSGLMFRCL